MVEFKTLQDNNETYNSPFLIDCKGCEYNMSKKKYANDRYMIYIEKEVAVLIKGKWDKSVDGKKFIKPYMSLENLVNRNERVVVENMERLNDIIDTDMRVDNKVEILRENSRKWLNFLFEKEGIYSMLNDIINFNLRILLIKKLYYK